MTSLNGKVVLITGGARGVGAEVARRLHKKGAELVLTDLDEAPLAALAAELGGGPNAGPAEQDHLRRQLRRCVRQGHRGPETSGELPRLGGPGPVAQARPVHVGRRGASAQVRPALLPRMDAEVAALGRSAAARTEEWEK